MSPICRVVSIVARPQAKGSVSQHFALAPARSHTDQILFSVVDRFTHNEQGHMQSSMTGHMAECTSPMGERATRFHNNEQMAFRCMRHTDAQFKEKRRLELE